MVKIVIKLLYLSNQSELFHGSKTILCLNLFMISALVIFIQFVISGLLILQLIKYCLLRIVVVDDYNSSNNNK